MLSIVPRSGKTFLSPPTYGSGKISSVKSKNTNIDRPIITTTPKSFFSYHKENLPPPKTTTNFLNSSKCENLSISTNTAKSLSDREIVVVVGGGQLATVSILEALARGSKVFCCSSANPSSELEKNKNYTFIKTGYKEGSNGQYWSNLFKKISADEGSDIPMRILNTRGTSELRPEMTYKGMFFDPAMAIFHGMKEGIPHHTPKVFVNFSSTMASIEGFWEYSEYASWRKQTDEALANAGVMTDIPVCNLRCDLVILNSLPGFKESGNHGASPLDFAQDRFQCVIGPDRYPAIQFVDGQQVVAAAFKAPMTDVLTVNAVGRKAFTQLEAYQFYADLIGYSANVLKVPFPVADWVKNHAAFAQMKYGIELLKHIDQLGLDRTLDATQFENLIKETARSLPEIYDTHDEILIGAGDSPTMRIFFRSLRSLCTDKEALIGFYEKVIPYIPALAKQAFTREFENLKNKFDKF